MSEADIPDFKKKEKEEKKKAGFWWRWLKGKASWRGAPGGPSGGLGLSRGAAGAAASAAARSVAAGAVAESGAVGFWGGLAGIFGRLAGTLAGKAILALMAAMLVAGGIAAYKALQRGAAQAGAGGGLELGAPGSSLKVRGPGGGSMDYAAQGAKGELKFDDGQQAPAPPQNEPAKEEVTAQNPEGENMQAEGRNQGSKLPQSLRDRFGQTLGKLSTGMSGVFGDKSIFNNSSAPKFSLKTPSGPAVPRVSLSRKTTSMARASRISAGRATKAGRGFSPRAIGQLKLARTLSGQGLSAGTGDAARTSAADAFDQSATPQGGGSSIAGPSDKVVSPNAAGGGGPSAGGAPDVVSPPMPTYNDQPQYQQLADAAKNAAKEAAKLKNQGTMMMMMGLALIAIGIALVATGFAAGVGWALIAAGAAMLLMAMMMLNQSKQMGEKGKQIAGQLANMENQSKQGEIMKSCIDQAVANGTDPDACQAEQQQQPKTNVKKAVEEEQGSSYCIEDKDGRIMCP
ncbi:MAG: hypothetical protein HY921_09295 [Elusimicrobia bacterium]|nr:hypothetical protein [Elusimicrobiota bacterium]